MTVHYIGIDIGGTNIKAALVSESGNILERDSAPTPATDLPALVKTVRSLASAFQAKTPVTAVGVGIAGLLSSTTGIIQTSPNIPCLLNTNLQMRLATAIGLPVVTENDANAGAYGEWACGAGRGKRHIVYVTLGTGLGSGLVLDGRLYRGASGYAGELGHTIVEPAGRWCACGSHGCLETRASATGIVLTARERGIADATTTAADLYTAALGGNASARAVFEETGRYLGMACASLINLLNPEAIVMGGGVLASGDLLLDAAREEVSKRAFRASAVDCPIVQSQLWPDAGVIGGAMLARDAS